MVIILSSLLVLHNFRYTTSVGSNMILFKTQSLVVFQILWFFLLYLSIYFLLYYWSSGEFSNIKALQHLRMKISLGCFCLVLLCFSWRGIHFHTFTLKQFADVAVTGQEVLDMRVNILSVESIEPFSSLKNQCLQVTRGHSPLDSTHFEYLKELQNDWKYEKKLM